MSFAGIINLFRDELRGGPYQVTSGTCDLTGEVWALVDENGSPFSLHGPRESEASSAYAHLVAEVFKEESLSSGTAKDLQPRLLRLVDKLGETVNLVDSEGRIVGVFGRTGEPEQLGDAIQLCEKLNSMAEMLND